MSKKPLKLKATAYSFTVAALRANPKVAFAAVKAAAAKQKLKVVPIIYGRAKLALGLQDKVAAKARAAKARAGSVQGYNGVASQTLAHVRFRLETAERCADRYGKALQEIRAAIDRALA